MKAYYETQTFLHGKALRYFATSLAIFSLTASSIRGETEMKAITLNSRGDICFAGTVNDGITTVLGQEFEADGNGGSEAFLAAMTAEGQPLLVEPLSFIPMIMKFDNQDNLIAFGPDADFPLGYYTKDARRTGPRQTLIKYDSNFELDWHLDDNAIRSYFDADTTEVVYLFDLVTNTDESITLIGEVVESQSDDRASKEMSLHIITDGSGPVTIFADNFDLLTVKSLNSEVIAHSLTHALNNPSNFLAVDGTQLTVGEDVESNFEDLMKDYNLQGDGFHGTYKTIGQASWEYGVFMPDVLAPEKYKLYSPIRKQAKLYMMNVNGDGSLNWKKLISTHQDNRYHYSPIPSLAKNSNGWSVYMPYEFAQIYGDEITLGNGTSLEELAQTGDIIVISTDTSGNITGTESVLSMIDAPESLPFEFDTSILRHTIGQNGELFFREQRKDNDIFILDAPRGNQVSIADLPQQALSIAFPDEGTITYADRFCITGFIGSQTEWLVTISSTIADLVGTYDVSDAHGYQLLVRLAFDGSIIDVIPVRRISRATPQEPDRELRITADANGNYVYVRGDPKAEEDEIDFGEYNFRSLDELVQRIAMNKGPFSGLAPVQTFWRHHWKFGWVYEYPETNWWYSNDLHNHIWIPDGTSDIDLPFYLNGEGWYWTNQRYYTWMYSFNQAAWLKFGE